MRKKMRIKIYRKLTKEEEQGLKKIPIAKLIMDKECEKITLNIGTWGNNIPFIDSITVDDKTLLLDEYKDMNFLQVFRTKS